MTLQNLLQLNVITKYMFCTIVNDKGMVNDMAPYWRIQKKFKSKEIYVLDIDYVHNTIYVNVR
jgi:hypothetical protein|nr:MAG TPA: hypothetical protein [Caudoviricetes sp.]